MTITFNPETKTILYGNTVYYTELPTDQASNFFGFALPNSGRIIVVQDNEHNTRIHLFINGKPIKSYPGLSCENKQFDALVWNDFGPDPLKVFVALVVFLIILAILIWIGNQGVLLTI